MSSDISLSGSLTEDPLTSGAAGRLRCSRVEMSASGIREWRRNRISNIIPRDRIRKITLCNGTDVRYPFGRFALGFALISLNLLNLAVDFLDVMAKGHAVQAGTAFILPLAPLVHLSMAAMGFLVLSGVFRVRYFFQIDTDKGISRISFGKSASDSEVRQFIWEVKKRFGYVIDTYTHTIETEW